MVSLKPLTAEEYTKWARKVTVAIAGSKQIGAPDLVGSSIFGTSTREGMSDRLLQQFHMRGYIDINQTPVVNPVLARGTTNILATVLGIDYEDMQDICGYKVVLDNGELVDYTELPESMDITSIKVGAQILEEYIKKFNMEKELQVCMRTHIFNFYEKLGVALAAGLPGKIVRTPTDMPIIGEWYFEPINNSVAQKYMDWYASLPDSAIKRMVYINRLCQLPDGRERLYGCVLHRIMVTPIGTRPSSDNNRHDTLTTAYAEVIKNQENLVLNTSGYASVSTTLQAYKMFDDSVRALLVTHSRYRDGDKAIVERLKSKKGIIRNKMLGKRVDFSGRSVITIDPFMSIRDIGVPKDMIPKLYRSATLRTMADPKLDKYVGTRSEVARCNMNRIKDCRLMEDINIIIGRQPTLHKPSMRSFHPVAVDGRSIQLNPLSVIGFNADFDGDQMYIRVPTTKEGIVESNELLGVTQNLFWPKNGECIVTPRQEIIYGLSVCTRETDYPAGKGGGSYGNVNELIEAISKQDVSINSQVSCGGNHGSAGRVAFLCCINRAAFTAEEFESFKTVEVTASTVKPIVNKMVRYNPEVAVTYIDSMVRLGFIVAGIYPPSLNLLDVNVDYSTHMDKFHSEIEEDSDLYQRGWETEAEYDQRYTEAFDTYVDKPVTKTKVGEDYGSSYTLIEQDAGLRNGFTRMARSGARGSKSNLLQLYGYKGRVQDGTSGGSFRAVIEHSYVSQLTPLEHFVTAYGGRGALIQKSLSTADSGYTMRKIWHTTSPFTITMDDCGTHVGINISISEIIREFNCDFKAAGDIFVDIVTGRYLAEPYAGFPADRLIDAATAKAWVQDKSCHVLIRSILTCKNPCCKKCYGLDLSTNHIPAIGLPIGFIAAQSIGEPGTQMNMDAFKKGGVASAATTQRISGFNKLIVYSECMTLDKSDPSYDPVAWTDGPVKEKVKPGGTKVITIGNDKRSVTVPAVTPIKAEVKQGEGLRRITGDKNVSEILRYSGLLSAQLYLSYALYSVYKDEAAVNFKHFEVLAEAMTMWRVLTTDQLDLVPGLWHDAIMMTKANLTRTTSVPGIKSVKAVQLLRPYALSRIAMEHVSDGLATSTVLGLTDPLTYPFNRILMGLTPWDSPAFQFHGDTNDFITQRRL